MHLHIVVFTDTFLETSGVGTYYRTLLDQFRGRCDVRLTIVCPDPVGDHSNAPTPEVIALRPFLRRPMPLYPDLTFGVYWQRTLRKLLDDLPGRKVAHIATPAPLGIAAAKAARRAHLPTVGCYHTDMPSRGRVFGQALLGRPGAWLGRRLVRFAERRAYASCDVVYAPTPSAVSAVGQWFDGPTEWIPNPIDPARFRSAPTREGWFREKYHDQDRVLAVAVGRLAKEKDLNRLCELLAPDPRIRLVLVGDGPEREPLQRRWGVPVTGFLQGDRLVEAYQQADVFVQISNSETFGLCLAESLACGLPAVALRAPGLTADMDEGCGVDVLEPDELPRLADRCAALVRDARRYDRFCLEGRRFAQRFGTGTILDRWIGLHDEAARMRESTAKRRHDARTTMFRSRAAPQARDSNAVIGRTPPSSATSARLRTAGHAASSWCD